MAELLHEYWENEDGGEFGPVRERSDKARLSITPDARLVFSLFAASWHQATQLYRERLDYGDFQPVDGALDHFYSDSEKSEQDAYLRVRRIDGITSSSLIEEG